MFIHRLRLLNFRQHEHTDLALGPGLTGIIGPNGAGKTTLLEAIAWAMYGMRAARGSRVCSSSGSITFSSSVIEPNSAPDCHITPSRARSDRRAVPVSAAMSCPRISIVPERGGNRPISSLSNVDLPQPDPPRITKTSPRRTSKETSWNSTREPKAIFTSRTRMTVSPLTG